MWSSVVLLFVGAIAILSARRIPEGVPVNANFWKNGREYSTIPLKQSIDRENNHDCECLHKLRLLRQPKLRTVIRRNDVMMGESEETVESYLEDYLLRLYLSRGFLGPPRLSSRMSAKSKSRTEKQVQNLPAFQHEKVEYSDEDNFRMSHNSRFYSQEPVPGQLLYPPVSPKFQPSAKAYANPYVSGLTKPRYVSSMLIPHFLNKTISQPNETVRNIFRMNSTETENNLASPIRIRYGKNSGHINIHSANKNDTAAVSHQ
ncbi:uncharacterized protein LOC135713833 [Ochlerotatus camptorhynchus]|uniref:uncharacterized protein LOC135713833 n=1 Tax=Ochlerotatus camptorhynchus TaxID=644619 RepID=UPI0031D8A4F7